MLQCVVVSFAEEIKPIRTPRGHCHVGMEFAIYVDSLRHFEPLYDFW
jgi:hypothetical protein